MYVMINKKTGKVSELKDSERETAEQLFNRLKNHRAYSANFTFEQQPEIPPMRGVSLAEAENLKEKPTKKRKKTTLED